MQEVRIRSVLTCNTQPGVCGKCYGRDLARGTPVNMGEAVGVIAAQSIGEPGTQLTMRTFHIGGAAQISEQSFVESNFEGTVKIKNLNVARNSDGDLIAMSRNLIVAVLDPDGTERAVHRIQYGARLKVNDGEHIKRGQRIAEWDPYTRPIMTEVEGSVGFEDLVEGQSMTETLDEVDRHRQTRGHRLALGLRPRPAGPASGAGDQGQGRQDPQAQPWRRCPLHAGGRRHHLGRSRREDEGGRRHRPYPDRKRQDARHHRRSAARRRIVRGPASQGMAVIAEISGTVRFGRDYKNKRRITIEPTDKGEEPREYLVAKGKHIHLQDGDVIEKGDFIVEGNPAPHDILAIKGVEELAGYLVNEIQDVYRLQGVAINDKHIEVIVRQMLQKVEINDSGETDLIQGEQVDKVEMDEVNVRAVAEGKKPASGHPVLLGITKASLQTRSFISAASFQETTRVLTEAAVSGKADTLDGLKENVIVGRLIPAGTGAMMNRLREVAIKRDQLILAEREKEAAAKAAAAAAEPAALPAAE